MAKENRSPNPRKARSDGKPPQPKPGKIDMDAAVEESTPGNVMWKLGILASLAMIIISLLFASINGGSKYVGEGAKPTPTPTPPVVSAAPDQTDPSPDASTVPDGSQTAT